MLDLIGQVRDHASIEMPKAISFALAATTGGGKTVMAGGAVRGHCFGAPIPTTSSPIRTRWSSGCRISVTERADPASVHARSRAHRMNFAGPLADRRHQLSTRRDSGKIYPPCKSSAKRALQVRGPEPQPGGTRRHSAYSICGDRLRRYHAGTSPTSKTVWRSLSGDRREAHRGMGEGRPGSQAHADATLSARADQRRGVMVPGIPLVIGISATIERFIDLLDEQPARAAAASRTSRWMPPRCATRVCSKDRIALDHPEGRGPVRDRAAARRRRSCWSR